MDSFKKGNWQRDLKIKIKIEIDKKIKSTLQYIKL